ncbi:MAG: hypothetical protein PHH59_04860 [Methylovulum sp.]|uniref:hypothetical protein n=1 Tax=Methylovulum sp. TaxID=1916980 RepID=UPI00261B5A61|nr:hypothetical protein [Methylovulum sp.]MDD2723342.1 hypothetical protein [Methylovulum sp.]MDD5124690.1 hypothetical protein [Methylovulum sp.]
MKKINPSPKNRVSLLDRLAVAWLSGVTSAITGGIFYAGWINFNADNENSDVATNTLIGFVLIMTVLGFFLLENLLARILGWLWSLLATNG